MDWLNPYSARWDDLEAIERCYTKNGFVLMKGMFDDATLDGMTRELEAAQAGLVDGSVDPRYGSELLDEPGAEVDGQPHRHYVINCTDLCPQTAAAAEHRMFADITRTMFRSDAPWLNDYARFGVVYQDARPDPGSNYSRIGWHSDFQSDESIVDSWPAFAFTIHIDGTSPANGFLRVVPGSHLKDADKDELGARGFDFIPGEVPVFAERGDVILHDYKLWHSAARGTADGAAGRRRHVRGSWHGGVPLPRDHGIGVFYKNAAR